MNRSFITVFAIACFVTGMACRPAAAQSVTLYLNSYDPSTDTPTNLSLFTWGTLSMGGSSITAINNYDPVLTANASATLPFQLAESGYLSYDFEVTGPATGGVSQLPVDITAHGSVTSDGNSQSIGQLYLRIPTLSGVGYLLNENLETSSTTPQSFSLNNQQILIAPNSTYEIVEYVGASQTASASIDPRLVIDQTFASNNPGYNLIFSPGLVPEPSTWVLLLGGFGTLAFRYRCRHAAA